MENKLDFAGELDKLLADFWHLVKHAHHDASDMDTNEAFLLVYFAEYLEEDTGKGRDVLRELDTDTEEGMETVTDTIAALAVRLNTLAEGMRAAKGMRACAALAAELSERIDALDMAALRWKIQLRDEAAAI